MGEAARCCRNWPPSPGVFVIGPFLGSILGVVGPKKTGEGIKHLFFLGGGGADVLQFELSVFYTGICTKALRRWRIKGWIKD